MGLIIIILLQPRNDYNHTSETCESGTLPIWTNTVKKRGPVRDKTHANIMLGTRGSQGYGRKGSTTVSINSIIHTIAKNRQFLPLLFPGQNALPMVRTIQLDEKTKV